MIRFEKRAPLAADHVAIRVAAQCPLCNRQFHAGDVTTSVPVRELTPGVFACAIAHWTCAERVKLATLADNN